MYLNHDKSFVQRDLKAERELQPWCYQCAGILGKIDFNGILLHSFLRVDRDVRVCFSQYLIHRSEHQS